MDIFLFVSQKLNIVFQTIWPNYGAPENFTVTIREIKVSAGAGFIVALTGSIMTMPGLPKVPAAEKIDVLPDGKIVGLF